MRPVKVTDLEVLLNRNSILILDVTNWAVGFIRQIISHSPGCISTKTGNKTLPIELWLQIISYAEYDENLHVYRPVYPIKMGTTQFDGSETKPALTCNLLQEWRRCGRIWDGTERYHYERCLNNPSYDPLTGDRTYNPEEDFKRPFEISKTPKEDTFSIPVSHLDFENKILFRNIYVADMIAWLEGGECYLCGGDNRVHCAGCGDGPRVMESFTSSYRTCCSIRMLCPLCIGTEYAEASVQENDRYDELTEKEREEDEESKEYEEWVNERFRELGYRW
ncbi:hypothetical protein F53441_11805 [Fusarium austroafricanum]|uniref:Uncharacterized protein n=1 Tax=Fusarium austroafricanum TaxID=2364996 RepID=A0A8H4K3P4_9HYPO|nr:hypothetical protein F53441_11805 [Fusarium austroafricanum]